MTSPFRHVFLILAIGLAVLTTACAGNDSPEGEAAPIVPTLELRNLRAGVGEPARQNLRLLDLPQGVRAIEAEVDVRRAGLPELTFTRAPGLPEEVEVHVAVEPGDQSRFVLQVNAPEGIPLPGDVARGTVVLGSVEFAPSDSIVRRTAIRISNATGTDATGAPVVLDREEGSYAVALITDPTKLFAFLACIVAGIYALAQWKLMAGFFRIMPPLIWMYFVPMFTTTIGITPDSSTLYSPFMSTFFLPAVLVILLLPSDVKALARLGPRAALMMLFATAGIVTGAIVSFATFNAFFADALPADTWKGVAALSGSWIGGGANMMAIVESVGTPPGILAPLLIVDTVVAYTWLGVLITLTNYQHRIDKKHRAKTEAVDEISKKLLHEHETNARSPRTADVAFIIGIALIVSQFCMWLGGPVFGIIDSIPGLNALSGVINAYGWGILLITAITLMISLTPARKLDYCGASSMGYVGLYLILTTFGARANLGAILDAPLFFGIGAMWLLIHICFLYAGVRILRAPLFLGATSSMANMGGAASAPVVAAAYNQSMAPVGLLMAILGATLGTPLAFFVAFICQRIAGG